MPVYLCQSGSGFNEPWRHGIQVYAAPFSIPNAVASGLGGSGATASGSGAVDGTAAAAAASQWEPQQQQQQQQANPRFSLARAQQQQQQPGATAAASEQQQQMLAGMPIRRVRHAEIVLVDDVCVAFGRYWLRLRWPGQREGFAGYIAMGVVSDARQQQPKPSGTFLLFLCVYVCSVRFASNISGALWISPWHIILDWT